MVICSTYGNTILTYTDGLKVNIRKVKQQINAAAQCEQVASIK